MIIKEKEELERISIDVVRKLHERFSGTGFTYEIEDIDDLIHSNILIGSEELYKSERFYKETEDIFKEFFIEKKINNIHFAFNTDIWFQESGVSNALIDEYSSNPIMNVCTVGSFRSVVVCFDEILDVDDPPRINKAELISKENLIEERPLANVG